MNEITIGNARLLNGDCMEYIKDIPDNYYELAIVDPPYGIGMDRGMKGNKSIDKRDGKLIQRRDYIGGWDNARPDASYFRELIRVSKSQLIWGGNYFSDMLPPSTHWIFWDKQNPMPSFGDGELCYSSSSRKSITKFVLPYWGHQKAGELERISPCQKPVKLYEWLLTNYAKAGDKILDTHGGSFSSAIACNNIGFDFTGIELDKDYYDAAVKRVEAANQQLRMFT